MSAAAAPAAVDERPRRAGAAGRRAAAAGGAGGPPLVPTYPNYDAYYHLVWGRELLDGHRPSFEAYQAPTQHPLYLALCALLGACSARTPTACSCSWRALALVALAWAVVPRRRRRLRPLAGAGAALFIASSFAFLLYAARAYVDVPFLALVLWAAALEARGRAAAAGDGAARSSPGCCAPRPGCWPAPTGCGARGPARRARPARARPAGARRLGARRPVGDRRPAALAARHERPRRRAGPRARRGEVPGGVRDVPGRHGAPAGRAGRAGAGAALAWRLRPGRSLHVVVGLIGAGA